MIRHPDLKPRIDLPWWVARDGKPGVTFAVGCGDEEIATGLTRAEAHLIANAQRIRHLLAEAGATLRMWADVAPAESLVRNIDDLLATIQRASDAP